MRDLSKAVWTVLLAVGLAGCANPGPPRPPSLRIPRAVTGLRAERVGGRVELNWTNPERTTDGLLLKHRNEKDQGPVVHAGPYVAEICRFEATAPAVCVDAVRQAAEPAEAGHAVAELPDALRGGDARVIGFRVRVLNGAGKSSAAAEIKTAAGAAPEAVRGLQARAVTQGAELKWEPAAVAVSGDVVRIERTESAAKSSGQMRSEAMTLTVAGQPDPGGAVDRGAEHGAAYGYRVRRVRVVHAGATAFTEFGEAATVETGELKVSVAPAAPAGLAAIAVPASAGAHAAIDLSWEPSTQQDVTGYVVYRSEANGAFRRVSVQAVAGTAYHDETTEAGRRYIYRVTAVDRFGKESRPSHSAEEISR